MSTGVDLLAPVRAGDVFDYVGSGRFATIMRTLPGGRAELRIAGTRNGKPSLMIGEDRIATVKTWPRVGRAEYLDGCYLPFVPVKPGVGV